MISFGRKHASEFLILAFGLAAVNFIFISKAFRQSTTVDPEYAGHLGSFVGGYVGSIFSLIAVILLVKTLKAQQLDSRKQNFETKYFELLKMHRDNVAEIGIKEESGRRAFVLMIRELRCAHEIIRGIAKECGQELSKRQLLHVAYYCLFYGVGPNSSRMFKISLYESGFDAKFVNALEEGLNNQETKEKVAAKRKFGYLPFEGHQSRLGHYYRHLYQMIRYVDDQPASLGINKYEYAKTIRAQLSTHEQALLLINSLSPIGQNWWMKNLIENTRLVQNIPREFFDTATELDFNEILKPGYFEWEEVQAGTSVSVQGFPAR
jgi:hypothetical protein